MADKNCGLYIRVSSEKQASVEEGSLRNQEQQLRQFVQMKHGSGKESWAVAKVYIDGGKSAKDTNRAEYQLMLHDIEEGKVNTVLVCALSRISRSVRDLLDMVDNYKRQNVDFISIKEHFDTTSAAGKMLFMIMAVLNEFEREQTSERTIRNLYTRATRGLFHGGHVLGYDPDPEKKGNLIPNKKEAELVRRIFDEYLEYGSAEKVAANLNKHGYATKAYVTPAGARRGGMKFCYSSTLYTLSNLTYVGIREINKMNKGKDQVGLMEEQRYITCGGTWQPIVDRQTFDKVQVLLKENCEHKNNGAKPTKHSYLFNGQLTCHKCGARMEGRNGHGHLGKIYFYYYCTNQNCRFKVPEAELEAAVQHIVKAILLRPSMMAKIAAQVNARLYEQLPKLRSERESIESQLVGLKNEFTKVMDNCVGVKNGRDFIEERLAELERMKIGLTERLEQVSTEISCLENKTIDADRVERILAHLDVVFKDGMKPFQKKILLTHLLAYLKLCDKELTLGIEASKFRSDITQVLRFDGVHHVKPGSQFGRSFEP